MFAHLDLHPASLALLLACLTTTGACKKPVVEPTPAPLRASVPPVSAPDAPVVIPASDVAAPFLEGPEQGTTPSFGRPALIAMGERVSIHRTARGLFAVHADEGVLGQLELPEDATDVVVDGDDAIWILRRGDGLVARSPDALSARDASSFDVITTIPDARAIDVNAGLVIVGTARALHVSRDLGESFADLPLPDVFSLQQVFVRADGVMVVHGAQDASPNIPVVYLSADGGASLTPSPFHSKRLLRYGSWIWNGDPTCVATLAADGEHWSSKPSLDGSPGYKDPRNAMLALVSGTYAPALGQTIATLSSPPPPTDDASMRHTGTEATCQDPIPTARELEEAAARAREEEEGRGPQPVPCRGAQCLREFSPTPPRETRTQFWLLADAHCEGDTSRACDGEGATSIRSPHLAIFDRREDDLSIKDLPAGCVPHALHNASGMAVLVCRGEEASVYTRSVASTSWSREIVLPVPHALVGALSLATDGTAMLHGVCPEREGACASSFLRAPVEAGSDSAWSEVKIDNALAVIPVDGGAAIAVSVDSEASTLLTIWYAAPGRSAARWIDIDDIERPVRGIRVGRAGVLELLMGEDFEPEPFVILGDGSLE